jgi:hypothetical protein
MFSGYYRILFPNVSGQQTYKSPIWRILAILGLLEDPTMGLFIQQHHLAYSLECLSLMFMPHRKPQVNFFPPRC